MQQTIREFDIHLDAQKRITLHDVMFESYHVSMMADGKIVLEPHKTRPAFQISAKTLAMMDKAVQNMKEGKVSEEIDLSEFED